LNPVTISVIVPAFNASATIGKALEALSVQNCFQPFEVIVVDDGSFDNTPEIVASFVGAGRPVRYIRQENAGPASARNHGARVARGEYLAFTDSDCVPHADWLALLMAGFSKPHIGVVAGSYGIANPESRLARCICAEILWRHKHLMPDFPKSFGSYNFCVKRDVFEAVGGFNTVYRSASGEDNDLSYKIKSSGWRIFLERKALVDHYHPTRVFKYLKEQFRHGFWRLKIYQDHPRMMRGDGYTFWKDILEMPCAVFILTACALSIFHIRGLGDAGWYALILFWLFEMFFAFVMTQSFFDGIFFGFVFLFRAFARMFGFSTGILLLLPKRNRKIL